MYGCITEKLHEVDVFPVLEEHVEFGIVGEERVRLGWHLRCHQVCLNDVRVREETHVPHRPLRTHIRRCLKCSHHELTLLVLILIVTVHYRKLQVVVLQPIPKPCVKTTRAHLKKLRVFDTN